MPSCLAKARLAGELSTLIPNTTVPVCSNLAISA